MTQNKIALLTKCVAIIQSLPPAALEEACEELEGIARFYQGRNQAHSPEVPKSRIKGKLRSVQVRPPITLEG